MRIAYLVSRFPTDAETWFLRELNAVDSQDGIEVELLSLFPPARPFVHPGAERWVARRHRPPLGRALLALAGWLARRPLRTLSSLGAVVAGHARRPAVLARALVTFPLAADHARTVRRERIAHVHAHFATYPALAAWLCHRWAGVGYSFTAHAHDIFVDDCFLARKVRDARFVVAISEFNRRFLAPYGGDSATPVEVVHCGVDPDAYAFRPRRPPAEGPVRALCVASLQEHKGHPVLLEAIAGEGPQARIELDLVGGGEREPLARLARKLGVADRVRFHGSLREDEVARLLDGCDLFVLPSLIARDGQMEGIPVALMEALAAGVPVVASDLSGIPELVRDGVTGWLARPADAAALRRALVSAVDGQPLDPRVGRELVERDFAVAPNARRLATLFAASVD